MICHRRSSFPQEIIEDIAAGGKDGIEAILKGFLDIDGTAKDAFSQLSAAALDNVKKFIAGVFKRDKEESEAEEKA